MNIYILYESIVTFGTSKVTMFTCGHILDWTELSLILWWFKYCIDM